MTHYLEDFGDLHLPATFRHRNIHQEVTSTGKCLGIITDTETSAGSWTTSSTLSESPQNRGSNAGTQYHPQNRSSGSPYFAGTLK